MTVESVTALALPDIKVVRFARFHDSRGHFAEPFRRGDFDQHPICRSCAACRYRR